MTGDVEVVENDTTSYPLSIVVRREIPGSGAVVPSTSVVLNVTREELARIGSTIVRYLAENPADGPEVPWVATAITSADDLGEEVWAGMARTRETAALRFEQWAQNRPIYRSTRIRIERAACSHGHVGSRSAACGDMATRLVGGIPYCDKHARWIESALTAVDPEPGR